MIVCILIPRFELTVAAGGPGALAGRALALAPDPARPGRIGEVSGAAQALGVTAGMTLGEALARAPALELVLGDPLTVSAAWEQVVAALEGIGAGVEPQRPGLACFDTTGLRGIHGGSDRQVIAAARAALPLPARLGAGPTRFCALAAALGARPRRTGVVHGDAAEFLRTLPVSLLRSRPVTAPLVDTLERLGIDTLGELTAVGRNALADRFGAAGIAAHRLAGGEDDPPRPRTPPETLSETLELPESASGPQLERALEVLIGRLLARRERCGRTLRGALLAARLADGGSWQTEVTFREALSDAQRMALVLAPRLALLPAPAQSLTLAGRRLGPPTADQQPLIERTDDLRLARLREAIAQARAAAGEDAALRAIAIDPASRFPERRMMLTPWEARR